MELSIEDLMKLQQMSAEDAVKISELKKTVEVERRKREELEAEVLRLKAVIEEQDILLTRQDYEMTVLKSYIILSIDKVRTFFSKVKDINVNSIVNAFLTRTIPEKHSQEQFATIIALTEVPEATPTINVEHLQGTVTGSVKQILANSEKQLQ